MDALFEQLKGKGIARIGCHVVPLYAGVFGYAHFVAEGGGSPLVENLLNNTNFLF